MAKFRFTRKAVEDLTNIWNYTVDTWSEQQADVYYEMLISSCRKVASDPVLFGREYNEIIEGLLGFKANKHIIFYRLVTKEEIEIVRILHERMDLSNKLGQ